MAWGAAAALGLALLLAALGFAGCGPGESALSGNALLVTQVPLEDPARDPGSDQLDLAFPRGSRVVLVPQPERPERLVVLSDKLRAAGSPVLGPDGRTVLFVGKADLASPWQVYRANLRGGPPVPVTRVEGGAMSPAWLPAGRFVFCSPVPRLTPNPSSDVPALFTQALTGGPPTQLTFGLTPATDPTVLADGRILFVSSVPTADPSHAPPTSLFTVNNDGTEITPFAGQHDGPSRTRRPRETDDGRIVFLSAGPGSTALDGRIEQVLAARPFRSRSVAFPQITTRCRSVEPAPGGLLLAGLRESTPDREWGTYAIYGLPPGASHAGPAWFDDPGWHDIEAVPANQPAQPMGRLSSVDPSRRDAALLCLDARSGTPQENADLNAGQRVRLTCHRSPLGGEAKVLGEAPLHTDGSFLALVPADIPLSIELLAADGSVLRRCPPAFWLRPGENRACIGCHEPHNHAPGNLRPLAVREAPVRLLPELSQLTRSPEKRTP